MSKQWQTSDIRALARQTVEGRNAMVAARGSYLRALIETAQAELNGKADQDAQLSALKAVHKRFYPVVQESIATDEILLAAGFPRKGVALERNRRLNFARSAYGTIKRWLRAPGHDLMKLNAAKTTKSQLENEAPSPRRHAMTAERIQKKAARHIDELVGFVKLVGKTNQAHATRVVNDVIDRLMKAVASNVQATTDATVAAQERRPLRVGRVVFMPTEPARAKAA